ncbi:MAG: chromate efflux transporter [Gammaproteobacteria bacterium]|nr:chromate efflux transporter [Gammaproteobacteria bacterium]
MPLSTSSLAAAVPSQISFTTALRFWLKLGFISFGGPAGQISIMHDELVERRRWISERRFLNALNFTMLLPGPEAQQLATYIGWLLHGIAGGIAAGLLFIVPSFFILAVLAWLYLALGDVAIVQGVLYGIKPAVTAIVLFAAFRIGSRALKNPLLWLLAVLSFVAIAVFNVPFPYIVLGAATAGLLLNYVKPEYIHETGAADNVLTNHHNPALVDDDTPIPRHAVFTWRRTALFVVCGIGIWASALGALTLLYGWQATFTQIGWFFTKAALLTFGGAYAVLPYVYQGGVDTYAWLTAAQMIDGLALGETTPGPLIMIVTFVGFIGGWTKAALGSESLLLSAWVSAAVATFFTFLPSFLFILVGGPAIEATRRNLKFAAPLIAITASVVGVIVNLAVFFAYHVLWPHGIAGHFEWTAAVFGGIAFVALFRFRVGVIPVIAVAALGGVIYQLLF